MSLIDGTKGMVTLRCTAHSKPYTVAASAELISYGIGRLINFDGLYSRNSTKALSKNNLNNQAWALCSVRGNNR
jgi:hypothetical protein